MIVRRCTIAELEAAPNLDEVLAEYATESSIPELGPARAQAEIYRAMESAGFLHPIAAFYESRLVGIILPIVITLPHYGVVAATVESFFVPASERKKGVGLELLARAKQVATELGAKALLLSAPVDSVLDATMRMSKSFRHSNNVYVVALT